VVKVTDRYGFIIGFLDWICPHVIFLILMFRNGLNMCLHFFFLFFFFLFLLFVLTNVIGQGISPSQSLYLFTEQNEQNKRTEISMPRVEFEPTTSGFERAKRVHALGTAYFSI
jgi:hypothetical protein